MKKIIIIFILSFFICMQAGTAFALPERMQSNRDSPEAYGMVLPASLVQIEEGAFENTAAESVFLPSMTAIIGNRAFASNRTLTRVFVPKSVESIGDQAFEGKHLTLFGEKDSYAFTWAQMHNVAFVEQESMASQGKPGLRLLNENVFLLFNFGYMVPELYIQLKKKKSWSRSMRPQDRPELYPINYRFP